MNTNRLNRLTQLMEQHHLQAMVFNPGPTLTYLTGLHFHLMERPTVLFVTPSSGPVLLVPALELQKVRDSGLKLVTYSDNPQTWAAAFDEACRLTGLNGCKVGVEPNQLRFMELRFMEAAAPQAQFVAAEAIVSGLRMQKDETEIAAMRKAVQIAQDGLEATLWLFKVGMTEHEFAAELTNQMLRAGSDPELPFQAIVAAGPNSANPHSTPSDRPIQSGELLLVDWGAAWQGYFSDLTRTFAVGEVEAELQTIARVVLEANTAGRAAGKPGVAAGSVDHAARGVIQSAGYADFFTHRTGHGLGMETHEQPYMFAENELLLAPGMTYTVEPGIYLIGRGGVRIEDDVVVTANGSQSLSDMPRELRVIA